MELCLGITLLQETFVEKITMCKLMNEVYCV